MYDILLKNLYVNYKIIISNIKNIIPIKCGCLNSDDIKAGYQLPVVALAFNIFPNQVTGIFGRENKMNSISQKPDSAK